MKPEFKENVTAEPKSETGEFVCRYTPEPPKEPLEISPVFLRNLFAIIALLAFISWWIYRYTDWFDAFTSLLAFGGVFSWLAFVSKILSENSLKALQSKFEERVMNNPSTTRIVVLCLSGFGLLACSLGTVDVYSAGDQSEQVVYLRTSGLSNPTSFRLIPGGRIRTLRATNFFFPHQILVKASGYPGKIVSVYPWKREELRVPESFLRPVVLVRTTSKLIHTVENFGKTNPFRIRIRITPNGEGTLMSGPFAFEGGAFWIGGDADLAIPSQLVNSWRAETGEWKILNSWRYPQNLRGLSFELQPKTTIQVEILNNFGSVYVSKDIIAAQPGSLEEFPQVEDLDVPHPH